METGIWKLISVNLHIKFYENPLSCSRVVYGEEDMKKLIGEFWKPFYGMRWKCWRSPKSYYFWYISHKMQRYTVYLFLENRSICFGWFLHPSSGVHKLYLQYLVLVKPLPQLRQVAVTVWQVPDTVNIVVCAPDDVWRYHPKHVEQFSRNK